MGSCIGKSADVAVTSDVIQRAPPIETIPAGRTSMRRHSFMSPGAFIGGSRDPRAAALYMISVEKEEVEDLTMPSWWMDYRNRLAKLGDTIMHVVVDGDDSEDAEASAEANAKGNPRVKRKVSVIRKMTRSASAHDLADVMAASFTEGLSLDEKWLKVSSHFEGATGLKLAAKLEVYSKKGEDEHSWERDEEQASNWPLRGKNALLEIQVRDRSR